MDAKALLDTVREAQGATDPEPEVWPPYTEKELRPVPERMSIKVTRWLLVAIALPLGCALLGLVLHLAGRIIAWGWRLV